jgi:hypothetical protein
MPDGSRRPGRCQNSMRRRTPRSPPERPTRATVARPLAHGRDPWRPPLSAHRHAARPVSSFRVPPGPPGPPAVRRPGRGTSRGLSAQQALRGAPRHCVGSADTRQGFQRPCRPGDEAATQRRWTRSSPVGAISVPSDAGVELGTGAERCCQAKVAVARAHPAESRACPSRQSSARRSYSASA